MTNYPSDPGTEARYLSLLITHYDVIIPMVEPAAIYEPFHGFIYRILRKALPVMSLRPLLSYLLDRGRERFPQFAYHLAVLINSGGRLVRAPDYLMRLRSVWKMRLAQVSTEGMR